MKLFDTSDPRLVADPYELYTWLRDQGPVYVDPDTKLHVVARYEDVVDVLSRAEDFSSRSANQNVGDAAWSDEARALVARGWPRAPALLTADPPTHSRHRRLVQHGFTPRRIRQLEQVISGRVEELIGRFDGTGRVELRHEFAEPLPLLMIADALGVPRQDIHRFATWSDAVIARIGRTLSPEEQVHVARRNVELQHYLHDRIRQRRLQPADDLLTDLVRAGQDAERPLDLPELLTILEQVLVAGNETTARLIVFVVQRLASDRELLSWVREDPDRLVPLVEEVLRLESPVQSKLRAATRTTTIAGVEVAAGARVMVLLGAANRDPDRFPNPDVLETQRTNLHDHLAFGYGPHFCVGAALARTEARLAVQGLLDRFRELRLAEDLGPGLYEPSFVHRGLQRLHLVLS